MAQHFGLRRVADLSDVVASWALYYISQVQKHNKLKKEFHWKVQKGTKTRRDAPTMASLAAAAPLGSPRAVPGPSSTVSPLVAGLIEAKTGLLLRKFMYMTLVPGSE